MFTGNIRLDARSVPTLAKKENSTTIKRNMDGYMKRLPALFSLLALVALPSCAQKEEEMEPDYDNMVMVDEDEDWISDEERDRKIIAGDLPDPRERIILEAASDQALKVQ
jgi:hypothetical protein